MWQEQRKENVSKKTKIPQKSRAPAFPSQLLHRHRMHQRRAPTRPTSRHSQKLRQMELSHAQWSSTPPCRIPKRPSPSAAMHEGTFLSLWLYYQRDRTPLRPSRLRWWLWRPIFRVPRSRSPNPTENSSDKPPVYARYPGPSNTHQRTLILRFFSRLVIFTASITCPWVWMPGRSLSDSHDCKLGAVLLAHAF